LLFVSARNIATSTIFNFGSIESSSLAVAAKTYARHFKGGRGALSKVVAMDSPDFPARYTSSSIFLRRVGRVIALVGIIAPLLFIGGLKFTQAEIEGLRPIIGGTPWLAWLYPVFGEAGASYLLGVVELLAALLLLLSPVSPVAKVAGGAIASLTFLVTCSTMLALPIWDEKLGFPALSLLGQFLIKDIALLGAALFVLGDGLARLGARP
jgi:uncharacterized membrane protein YkgB